MISVTPYTGAQKAVWDQFIRSSKNGTFLFLRDYMDYHADRFPDTSVLFHEGDELLAVLPATRRGDALVSHAGLTFGGIVSSRRMRTATMLRIFGTLREHLRLSGLSRLVYKRVPHIYHDVAAEEDLYALFVNGAAVTRRDVSAAIFQADRLPYTKGRKWSVNKSRKCELIVGRSDEFERFMELEAEHLQAKFGVSPVHTAAEMRLLSGRFPENIKLYTAAHAGKMLGGVIVYESRHVAHAQYIAATDAGKELCALDAILDQLITTTYEAKRWFDFGISTEEGGRYLNEGLIDNKESYGARAIVHEFFEITPGEEPAA